MRREMLAFVVLTSVLAVTMGAVLRSPTAREGRYKGAAIPAAAWVAASAITTSDGIVWPADPLDPKSVGTTLYTGSAGPTLFFLELQRLNGDAEHLRLARGGADALLASLDADEGTGLYAGIAGTGFTLGQAYLVARDPKYRDGALRAVRLLESRAKAYGDGVEWNDVTDIISGSSGTGLFLLWAGRELQAPGARALAVRAGRRLIQRAERRPDGTLKWMMN
jgi:lantibiotic modifying enzyme